MSLKKIAASMHVEAMKKGKSARTLSRGVCQVRNKILP